MVLMRLQCDVYWEEEHLLFSHSLLCMWKGMERGEREMDRIHV